MHVNNYVVPLMKDKCEEINKKRRTKILWPRNQVEVSNTCQLITN